MKSVALLIGLVAVIGMMEPPAAATAAGAAQAQWTVLFEFDGFFMASMEDLTAYCVVMSPTMLLMADESLEDAFMEDAPTGEQDGRAATPTPPYTLDFSYTDLNIYDPAGKVKTFCGSTPKHEKQFASVRKHVLHQMYFYAMKMQRQHGFNFTTFDEALAKTALPSPVDKSEKFALKTSLGGFFIYRATTPYVVDWDTEILPA